MEKLLKIFTGPILLLTIKIISKCTWSREARLHGLGTSTRVYIVSRPSLRKGSTTTSSLDPKLVLGYLPDPTTAR